MAFQDKKEEAPKIVPAPEKKTPAVEQAVNQKELEKAQENKEIASEEKVVADELRREIDLMQIDDNLKQQAEQKANKISFLADDAKLKQLLDMAREKGVIFAIQVAKKMNDPYILDTLHDVFAKEGLYKDFLKK